MIIEPIGIFKTKEIYKYELPRQGFLHAGNPGIVELFPHRNFEQALRDLEGFERIWLLFQFHLNQHFRPTVRPPVPPKDHERVGVFSSRSPYRPNPIGLSCVKLLSVSKLLLQVDEADLLNETPILDIKPYIPRADAFPEVKAGWVDLQDRDFWKISSSELFQKQNQWIEKYLKLSPLRFSKIQLQENPFDEKQKRVSLISETQGVLAYRNFRIYFSLQAKTRTIFLEFIRSGYSIEERINGEDPYQDKKIHLEFIQIFEDSSAITKDDFS